MGRFCIAILLIISINSYSKPPCRDEYIKVVKTDSCRYVEMGVMTYTDFYMHKKRLLEIKEMIPSIKDSLTSIKIHRNEIKRNMDSIKVYNEVIVDSLTYDRDTWREVSYELEDSLIDAEYELHKQKKNRFKWFGGGIASALLIFLIL